MGIHYCTCQASWGSLTVWMKFKSCQSFLGRSSSEVLCLRDPAASVGEGRRKGVADAVRKGWRVEKVKFNLLDGTLQDTPHYGTPHTTGHYRGGKRFGRWKDEKAKFCGDMPFSTSRSLFGNAKTARVTEREKMLGGQKKTFACDLSMPFVIELTILGMDERTVQQWLPVYVFKGPAGGALVEKCNLILSSCNTTFEAACRSFSVIFTREEESDFGCRRKFAFKHARTHNVMQM